MQNNLNNLENDWLTDWTTFSYFDVFWPNLTYSYLSYLSLSVLICPYLSLSALICPYQPKSTQINQNQQESTRIHPNQTVSTSINPYQPISALHLMQVPACFYQKLPNNHIAEKNDHVFYAKFCITIIPIRGGLIGPPQQEIGLIS